MLVEPRGLPVGRHRLGVVDEVAQHDDVGLQFRCRVAKQRELLQRVVIADAEIVAVDLAAHGDQRGRHPGGGGLVLRDAPAQGRRIAREGDARHALRRLLGNLRGPETVAVGRDLDAHQLRLGIGAVPMSEIGPHVPHLHVPCVAPHFEFVEHAGVEEEPGHALQAKRADSGEHDDQKRIL